MVTEASVNAAGQPVTADGGQRPVDVAYLPTDAVTWRCFDIIVQSAIQGSSVWSTSLKPSGSGSALAKLGRAHKLCALGKSNFRDRVRPLAFGAYGGVDAKTEQDLRAMHKVINDGGAATSYPNFIGRVLLAIWFPLASNVFMRRSADSGRPQCPPVLPMLRHRRPQAILAPQNNKALASPAVAAPHSPLAQKRPRSASPPSAPARLVPRRQHASSRRDHPRLAVIRDAFYAAVFTHAGSTNVGAPPAASPLISSARGTLGDTTSTWNVATQQAADRIGRSTVAHAAHAQFFTPAMCRMCLGLPVGAPLRGIPALDSGIDSVLESGDSPHLERLPAIAERLHADDWSYRPPSADSGPQYIPSQPLSSPVIANPSDLHAVD